MSDYWNVDESVDPKQVAIKPWGLFDATGAELDFPISFAAWLNAIGQPYKSHTATAALPLSVASSSQAGGVITVRIKCSNYSAGTHLGNKYPFTVRVVANDDQADERTFWLKLVDR